MNANQGNVYPPNGRSNVRIDTQRGLLKHFALSFITLGIYSLIDMLDITRDINRIASPYDGKNTMNYLLLVFIIAPLTCGIAPIVWWHNLSTRIGNELARRNISYSFGAADFWLWYVLGSFIIVGPFVYLHKMFVAMNKLGENYNYYGC